MSQSALQEAIDAAGGKAALARALGVSYQAINQWVRVPPLRVLDVEAATGSKISRHRLRPDLYPDEAVQKNVGAAA